MCDQRSKAEAYFQQGYNCAQSVLLAFCDETGLSQREAARLMSSFGGGFGGLRELCGAVSAMGAIVGLVNGYDDPAAQEAKRTQYADIRGLAKAFAELNGSCICRELLKGQAAAKQSEPEPRTPAYYAARPCTRYVGDAAELVAAYVAAHPPLER